MLVMSNERMRVASSDWCASRIVVSVNSTWLCAFIQRASPFGPSRSRICLDPSTTISGSYSGTTGAMASAGGRGRSRTSGCPLTVTSAI